MVTLQKGNKNNIRDVYYIPALRSNIISLGQLLEKGYDVHTKDWLLAVKNKVAELVHNVELTKICLFTLDIKSELIICLKAVIKDDSWLWHLRFDRLGYTGLKLLPNAKMVDGLLKIDKPSELCEACVKGKQYIQSFDTGMSWRARRSLEIVHTYIAGSFYIASLGENMYCITFIDDFSRKS